MQPQRKGGPTMSTEDPENTAGTEGSVGKREGKIAVITGGDSGIGLATAKRLVADGAYVFITGRRQRELEAAVAQIEQIARNVTAVQGDVSRLADLDRLFAAVRERTGP